MATNPAKEVGDLLESLKKSKVTDREAAHEIGVCERTIMRWKKGLSIPREAQIEKLKKFLSPAVKERQMRLDRIFNQQDIAFLQQMLEKLQPFSLRFALRLLLNRKVEADH